MPWPKLASFPRLCNLQWKQENEGFSKGQNTIACMEHPTLTQEECSTPNTNAFEATCSEHRCCHTTSAAAKHFRCKQWQKVDSTASNDSIPHSTEAPAKQQEISAACGLSSRTTAAHSLTLSSLYGDSLKQKNNSKKKSTWLFVIIVMVVITISQLYLTVTYNKTYA